MIHYHQIKVVSPFYIQRITDLTLEWKPGEHGRITLHAISDEARQTSAVLGASAEDEIQLFYNEGGKDIALFKGTVGHIALSHIQGVHQVVIEGVSGSYQLDIEKKKRSFPEVNQTYSELVSKVMQDYPNSDALHSAGEQGAIGDAILQYDETDWELFKRLASRLQAVIVCDILEAAGPKIYFGMPQGAVRTLRAGTAYTARKNLTAYKRAGGAGAGLHDTDFFQYEIETGERYAIGDQIRYLEKDMIVSGVAARMDKGVLVFTYTLSRPEGTRSQELGNSRMSGLSLEGEVLDVRGEEVKLRLDIDKDDGKADPHWYPFAPATGSAMYSMPKPGSKASLYFPDARGSRAMIVSAVRTNGEGCAKMGDPNNRYFGTEHGSELKLAPDMIQIMGNPGGTLQMSLNDATGVELKSPKKLTLTAGEELTLFTPKKITIRGTSLIMAYQKGAKAGVSVENEYHLLGTTVQVKGSDQTGYAPFEDEPKEAEPPPPPPPELFSWGKLLKKVAIGVAVVAAVTAVAVLSVATLGAATMVMVGVGAAVAGSLAVGSKAVSDIRRGEVSSTSDYALTGLREAGIGAVCGAIFGPFGSGGMLLSRMAAGGADGAFSSAVSQQLSGEKVNWKEVGLAGMIGFGTAGLLDGKVLGAVGRGLKKVGGKAPGWVQDGVSAVANVGGKTATWVKDGFSTVMNGFGKTVQKLKDAGSELGNAISRGSSYLNPKNYQLQEFALAGGPSGGFQFAKVGDEPLVGSGGRGARESGNGTSPKPKEPLRKPPEAEGTGKTAQEIAEDTIKKQKAKKAKKLREQYLGRTPGKKSRTGRKVIERMKNENPPKIRTTRSGKMEFKASDGEWYDLNKADMAHRTDAVSWWNSVGRHYGAKSKEVRKWMLEPDNYELDHYSLNRSAGAKLAENYLPPLKYNWR